LGGDEGKHGRGAIRRNARAEATLLLVDHHAEPFQDVHVPGPFHTRELAEAGTKAKLLTTMQPALREDSHLRATDLAIAVALFRR
jgi:hypothetical protein